MWRQKAPAVPSTVRRLRVNCLLSHWHTGQIPASTRPVTRIRTHAYTWCTPRTHRGLPSPPPPPPSPPPPPPLRPLPPPDFCYYCCCRCCCLQQQVDTNLLMPLRPLYSLLLITVYWLSLRSRLARHTLTFLHSFPPYTTTSRPLQSSVFSSFSVLANAAVA